MLALAFSALGAVELCPHATDVCSGATGDCTTITDAEFNVCTNKYMMATCDGDGVNIKYYHYADCSSSVPEECVKGIHDTSLTTSASPYGFVGCYTATKFDKCTLDPSSGMYAMTKGSCPASPSLKTCTSPNADCSGEVCVDIPKDLFGKCNPLGTMGMSSKTTCSGDTVTQEIHANADCSDDTSATCADLAAANVGGCTRKVKMNTCMNDEFTMGLSQKVTGSCPGGEDEEPCFSREAEACRVLDTSVAPFAAFRACFDEPAPTVAERVKMTALTGGDYVLSAGKDQAYEFTRVIVNQHKLNEKRSSILKIAHADGEIELTPDHVLLVDGQWAAAHTVKIGSSLSGSKVTAISHGVAGVINPVTVSGMIVAAGATGGPVVSSAYPEWIATYMLEQNNGYYPLPISMSNVLAYLFPATAQAYWDEVLEHAFAANQARLGSAKINLPTMLVAPIMFVLDLLCSAGLVLFALVANAKVLAALGAVAVVANARRAVKA